MAIEDVTTLLKLTDYSVVSRYGNTYYNKKDYNNAFKLYNHAANNGNMDGVAGLAKCYYYGNGVEERDIKKAYELSKKAYDSNGNIDAAYLLGLCYFNGHEGINKDYTKAFRLYEKAATAGHLSAANMLGLCYYKGYGAIVYKIKARQLWLKNSELGDEDATQHLKSML